MCCWSRSTESRIAHTRSLRNICNARYGENPSYQSLRGLEPRASPPPILLPPVPNRVRPLLPRSLLSPLTCSRPSSSPCWPEMGRRRHHGGAGGGCRAGARGPERKAPGNGAARGDDVVKNRSRTGGIRDRTCGIRGRAGQIVAGGGFRLPMVTRLSHQWSRTGTAEVVGRRRRRGRAAARRLEKVVHDPGARDLRSRRRRGGCRPALLQSCASSRSPILASSRPPQSAAASSGSLDPVGRPDELATTEEQEGSRCADGVEASTTGRPRSWAVGARTEEGSGASA
jgi:hypothetical protein